LAVSPSAEARRLKKAETSCHEIKKLENPKISAFLERQFGLAKIFLWTGGMFIGIIMHITFFSRGWFYDIF
jgi:hypothetical protein